jgi:hypothetical protein
MKSTSQYEFSLPLCNEEQQLQVQKALMFPGAITTATVNRTFGAAGVIVQASFTPAQSLGLMHAEIISRIAPLGLVPMRVPSVAA